MYKIPAIKSILFHLLDEHSDRSMRCVELRNSLIGQIVQNADVITIQSDGTKFKVGRIVLDFEKHNNSSSYGRISSVTQFLFEPRETRGKNAENLLLGLYDSTVLCNLKSSMRIQEAHQRISPFLVVGSSGSGMTSVVKEIAAERDIPIVLSNPRVLFGSKASKIGEKYLSPEASLCRTFNKAVVQSPCILLFDDIASMFPVSNVSPAIVKVQYC